MAIARRTVLAGGLASVALGVPCGAYADTVVAPGDDFYRYANDAWLRATIIPQDAASIDEFSRLSDLNSARVRAILETAAATPASDDARKIGDLYASLIDRARIEALGSTPIRAELDRIAAIATPADLARALARIGTDTLRDPLSNSYPAPIAATVFIDYKRGGRWLPTLVQGGLGLPDRAYYIGDRAPQIAARAAYRTFLTTIFRLAGDRAPDERAARAFAIEERLAGAQRSRAELFDFKKRYNLQAPADLARTAPGLDWAVFLDAAGMTGRPAILVADPDAFVAAAAMARDLPIADWRDYLTARALTTFAPYGPAAFADAHFAYAERALRGVPAPPPAWRRAAATVDLAMGPAVGAIYLERHFPPAARRAVEAMTGEIRLAMAARIERLAWMSDVTRKRALAKLAAVRIDIGGERTPRDYRSLAIDRRQAWCNVVAAARHEHARGIAKLDRPIDRGEWDMLPHTVNAQANPLLNKIMFPAGVIQPPLFDPRADPAANYGALGMFIGHELSHLFDPLGSMFDEGGRLDNWWQPADRAQFAAATATLAAQYDAYRPFPDLALNGRQTLNENAADLAGLAVALDAYRATLRGRASAMRRGERLFFLSFARLWRTRIRDETMRQNVAIGTHSHGEWRIATVRNLDAWYAAFGITPGDAMFLPPDRRVRLW